MNKVTSIVVAGIGGQGVIKCSDILADTVFRAGYDVKKAEIHGMSQRGGSVTSDIRFGAKVWSPMVSSGEADFLVLVSDDQLANNKHYLRSSGLLLAADEALLQKLPNSRSLNIALLGKLSAHLQIAVEYWLASIEGAFPPAFKEGNLKAFSIGRGFAV